MHYFCTLLSAVNVYKRHAIQWMKSEKIYFDLEFISRDLLSVKQSLLAKVYNPIAKWISELEIAAVQEFFKEKLELNKRNEKNNNCNIFFGLWKAIKDLGNFLFTCWSYGRTFLILVRVLWISLKLKHTKKWWNQFLIHFQSLAGNGTKHTSPKSIPSNVNIFWRISLEKQKNAIHR